MKKQEITLKNTKAEILEALKYKQPQSYWL